MLVASQYCPHSILWNVLTRLTIYVYDFGYNIAYIFYGGLFELKKINNIWIPKIKKRFRLWCYLKCKINSFISLVINHISSNKITYK